MNPSAARLGPAVLAMLTGWVALLSWQGMVAEPSGFLIGALLVGSLVVVVGSGLRALGAPVYAVALVQVLVAALSLNSMFAGAQSLLGVVPTGASLRQTVQVIVNGAATLNSYGAPVEVNPTHTRALLTACALAVLLACDVLAPGLRRPALVALPVLVTLSVPVSILTDALALPVFVVCALLFLRLLATEHTGLLREWGARARVREATDGPGTSLRTLWQVSFGAVVVALLAAPLVPVSDLLDRAAGDGTGAGSGSGNFELTAVNPMIRMRRDLVEQTNTPLVYAETEARSTSYLRTTVLDRFTSDEWRPSPRDLPRENTADGVFPQPPGLAVGTGGVEDRWSFEFAPSLATTWLPLPYPVRDVEVSGRWRFDSRTLDVAYVGGGDVPSNLSYRATSLIPSISAATLEQASRAPAGLRRAMTEVPDDLPEVLTRRAREVTQDAGTDFAKAVALQDWFRQGGGFRYSLQQRSGSGMDLLASFVTDDRVGYCEQFAAAMAAMGRTLGIPSRVVVGFLDGEEQQDGRILYTSDDRHAWAEMYFSGVGWTRFEPTPGQRTGASPSWTRESTTAPESATAPSDAARPEPAPTPDAAAADAAARADGDSQVPWWPVLLLLVVLVLTLAPASLRRWQRGRRLAADDPVHLAEGAWAELQATALDLGLEWPEAHSPREQARVVVGQVEAGPGELGALEALLVRVERGRYARPGTTVTVEEDVRTSTVHAVVAWRRVMSESARSRAARRPGSRSATWWRRLWPASLLRR